MGLKRSTVDARKGSSDHQQIRRLVIVAGRAALLFFFVKGAGTVSRYRFFIDFVLQNVERIARIFLIFTISIFLFH